MINDALGEIDLLSDLLSEDVEEIIRSPWADKMVRAVLKWRTWDYDDYAQEARVAMWKAADRWDGRGDLAGFLHQHARWRIQSLMRGDHKMVGQEAVRPQTQARGDEARERLRKAIAEFKAEHGREPTTNEAAEILGIHPVTVRKQLKKMTVTAADVEIGVSSLEALIEAYGTEAVFEAVDKYDALVLAYHYGEIHKAVSDLKPLWREYIFLRFWQGYGDAEATRVLGSDLHWSRDVRPVLAERLSHLVEAV